MPDTVPTPATPHDLLIAVRNVIRDNPKRHNQYNWLSNAFGADLAATTTTGDLRKFATLSLTYPANQESPLYPACGTVACVAGWAVILGGNAGTALADFGPKYRDIAKDAQVLLDLTADQANILFSGLRSRAQVLTCLDALIEDRDASLHATLNSMTDADFARYGE